MLLLVLHLLTLPVLFGITALAECQPKPIQLPIEEVSISKQANMRGVSVAVGSAPQTLSFLVNG